MDPSDGDNLHCRLYSNQPSTHNKIDLSSDNSGCSDSEVSVSEAKGDDAVNVDDDDNGSDDDSVDDDDDGSNDEVEGNVDDNDDSNSDDDSVDNNSDGDRDSDSATLKCFLLMFSSYNRRITIGVFY